MIWTLLNSHSVQEFDENDNTLTNGVLHFDSCLKKELTLFAGKWSLPPLHLCTPHSGITNIPESLITVLKLLIDWKEESVDSDVLSFYFLQNFNHNEIL